MSSNEELHQKAHKLRKEGKFKEAIPIYEKVWRETKDKFDGAGLIHCFRKENIYVKALHVAEQLKPIIEEHPDFTWGKREVVWSLIKGKLDKLPANSSLESVVNIANEIMNLKPEDVASKMVVFRVLKTGKELGQWDIVSKWADKLDPAKLSTTPMTDDKGREGWCDQALWYNYKGKALIELNKPDEVIQLIDKAISKFPRQKKILLRLKALGFHKLGKLSEAKECYKNLCSVRKPDWWLLHEYAKVLIDEGNKQQALKLMYQAALSNGKLELKVTLIHEMGLLYKVLGENDSAREHLSLSALVRCEQGWSIPNIISNSLQELNAVIGDDKAPKTVKDALTLCRKEWGKLLDNSYKQQQHKRKPRRGLHGRISLGLPDNKYCFIVDEKREKFFCLKSDLPEGVTDGAKVNFNAVPSFNKKKNRESWKSADICLSG